MEQYRVSAPRWARGEEHWWNRTVPVLAVCAVLTLLGAVGLWFGLTTRLEQQMAVNLGVGHVSDTLAAVARPLVALAGSGCLLYTILFLLALAVNVWESAVNGVRRYRSYMRRTTQPPVD